MHDRRRRTSIPLRTLKHLGLSLGLLHLLVVVVAFVRRVNWLMLYFMIARLFFFNILMHGIDLLTIFYFVSRIEMILSANLNVTFKSFSAD